MKVQLTHQVSAATWCKVGEVTKMYTPGAIVYSFFV